MGIPKDRLASFGLFLTPLQVLFFLSTELNISQVSACMFIQIMLPWMIGKWTAGPRPLNIFLLAYPYRLKLHKLSVVVLQFHFSKENH